MPLQPTLLGYCAHRLESAAATFGHGPRSQKQLWKLNFQRDTYNRLLDHMDHQKQSNLRQWHYLNQQMEVKLQGRVGFGLYQGQTDY